MDRVRLNTLIEPPLAERVAAVAAQTVQRVLEHVTPANATRSVSLHARPIRTEALGRLVEFAYKMECGTSRLPGRPGLRRPGSRVARAQRQSGVSPRVPRG